LAYSNTELEQHHPVIFLDSYPKLCYVESWFPGSPRWALAPTLRRPASLFANQLPLDPSTALCISFVFNALVSHRSRRASTGTLLSSFLSSSCKLFPLQQGGTPPSPYSPPFRRECAPRAQNRRTNCAFSHNNSFACHTCAFHGGEGGGYRRITKLFLPRTPQTLRTGL
jgi:hypothetical protein